jgi:hypothetical protein
MGQLRTVSEYKSDGKGMLYVENGDVDVFTAVKGKKAKSKIGDGKADPEGSLIVKTKSQVSIIVIDTGKKFMKTKTSSYMTTGEAHLVVSKSKTPLDGKRLPQDDVSGLLTGSLIGPGGGLKGQPIDLDAGTGTLVSTSAVIKGKSALGRVDNITSSVYVLSITR